MNTYAYKALGCKVNQYEGDQARSFLESQGLIEVPDRADLVILNTCAVTHRAVQKSRQSMRRLLHDNPGARAVLTGCLTEGDLPSFSRLDPEMTIAVNRDRDGLRETLANWLGPREASPLSDHQHRTRAYLKVQDGCNLRCSYCIIPSLRGRSRSRPLGEVIEEFKSLEQAGHEEVVLCGIHLGHWGHDLRLKMVDLCRALADAASGSTRIRLSSLEANELTGDLMELLGSTPVFAPHLHLPLQSGSPRILKEMRRPYTAAMFRATVEAYKQVVPDPAITTDIIIGFPGETESDFEHTLELAAAAGFSKIHAFPYSERLGTAAAGHPETLPGNIARARQARLSVLERNLRRDFVQRHLGTTAQVVFETESSPGRYTGFTERYIRVEASSEEGLPRGVRDVELLEDRGRYVAARILPVDGHSMTVSPPPMESCRSL